MANPEHLRILKQGVEQWNKWRKGHVEIRPDLSAADLRDANLREAYLGDVDLSDAVLSAADLSNANLREADLRRTDLRDSDLNGAGLGEANLDDAFLEGAFLGGVFLGGASLRAADLCRANLAWANLHAARLDETDLTEAVLAGTILVQVDLSTAKGLETVAHHGPSSVGIDTIYKSRGKIPEAFWRGCGVPDEFIAYIGSMVGRPVEFYSCFISYSTKDQEFADRLYTDLQAKGVRCWFAPHDIKGGRKLHEQIDEAILLHDKLLLILSEHSMSSNWVKTEIANAREREDREKKHLLFPISLVSFEAVKRWRLFDADRGDYSDREIREYFIPDFSNWKNHDSYQTAFQRLLKDLKAEASK